MVIPLTNKTKRLLARLYSARATVAAVSAVLIVVNAEAGAAIAPTSIFAAACNRNAGLNAYTFQMTVAMAMRHFPWLHFHINGSGQYVRGQLYDVNFEHMPFFATAFRTIDLSPLDPSMWQKQYAVRLVGQHQGSTTFSLRPKTSDRRDANPLVQAIVTLDSRYATRTVAMQYAHGTITLTIHPSQTQGYRLPAGGDVNIDMPGEALTAHAMFTQYTIQQTAVAQH